MSVIKNKTFGIISSFIGVLIAAGFLNEFMFMFTFDIFALIGLISASAFLIVGFYLRKGQTWARMGFLILIGLNAVASLGGVYFFIFPFTIVPSPEAKLEYLQASLLFGWVPFFVSVFFLNSKRETTK